MRVGLITDCYHPTPNGVTGVVGSLAAGLEARGHHVVLLAPRWPDGPRGDGPRPGRGRPDDPRPGGARAADHTSRSVPLLPAIGLRLAPATAGSVERLARRERLDLLHTHTEGPLGLAGRRAASELGIPALHTLHTFYEHYLHYLPTSRLAPEGTARTMRRALRWFLRPYHRVIAPSPAARDHVAELAPGVPTVLLPNGVEPVPPAPDEAEDRAIDQLLAPIGGAGPAPLLLSVGRVAPEKRARELVGALAAHLPRHPQARAMLVGGGRSLPVLRREVAERRLHDRIALPGILPHRLVLGLLRRTSVYVTASLSENHPLTLLESAAASVPLAVRRDPNLTGLAVEGTSAVVADGDDELVLRALALADDGPRLAALGAGARRLARRCSVEAHLDRTETLYEEVVRLGQRTTVRSRT
jgi:1,2-diacylglycerol 3-alpha-glucosyltransferase